jgi:peptidoglycan/xylan/chitin deacetylase (PgdA/CDA1 family)
MTSARPAWHLRWRRLGALMMAGAAWCASSAQADERCAKPVYLTIDTGHMGVAPLIVDVLRRQHVKATFFLANERTQAVDGKAPGMTLDDQWAPWWKALAAEGHDFGSHTWDHIIWRGDEPGGFLVQATSGPQTGQKLHLSKAQYCDELARPARRFEAMTGHPMRAMFRAPGGKTSKALLAAAQSCGWHHVPWSAAGFLGDELSSDRYPNRVLLDRAVHDVRAGDILLMHLGIWSRQDPWAPAVLEPLIVGLKARGLCFATLREHPDYAALGPAPR